MREAETKSGLDLRSARVAQRTIFATRLHSKSARGQEDANTLSDSGHKSCGGLPAQETQVRTARGRRHDALFYAPA
jgi:hypothetical protein